MLQRQRQRRQQRQTSIPERTHGNCHRDATTTTILFQLPTFFFISPFLNLFQCFRNDSVCQLLCRRYKYQARFGPTQSALPEFQSIIRLHVKVDYDANVIFHVYYSLIPYPTSVAVSRMHFGCATG